MPFTKEQILTAIDIIKNSSNISELQQKFNTSENRKVFCEGPVILEIILKGRVDFFEILLNDNLDLKTEIGDSNELISTYLISHKNIAERTRFIKLLLPFAINTYPFAIDPYSAIVLHAAIDENNEELFQTALELSSPYDLEHKNASRETPLLQALLAGKLKFALALLEKEQYPDNILTTYGDEKEFLELVFKRADKFKGMLTDEWQEFLKILHNELNKFCISYLDHPFVSFCLEEANSNLSGPIINSNILNFNDLSTEQIVELFIEALKSDNIAILTVLRDLGTKFDKEKHNPLSIISHARSVEATEIFLTTCNENLADELKSSLLFELITHGYESFTSTEKKYETFLSLVEYLINDSTMIASSFNRKNILYYLSEINVPEDIEETKFVALTEKIFSKLSSLKGGLQKFLELERQEDNPLYVSFFCNHNLLFRLLLEKANEHETMNIDKYDFLNMVMSSGRVEIVDLMLPQKTGSKKFISEEALLFYAESHAANGSRTYSLEHKQCIERLNESVKKIENLTELNNSRLSYADLKFLNIAIELQSTECVLSILSQKSSLSPFSKELLLKNIKQQRASQQRASPHLRSLTSDSKKYMIILSKIAVGFQSHTDIIQGNKGNLIPFHELRPLLEAIMSDSTEAVESALSQKTNLGNPVYKTILSQIAEKLEIYLLDDLSNLRLWDHLKFIHQAIGKLQYSAETAQSSKTPQNAVHSDESQDLPNGQEKPEETPAIDTNDADLAQIISDSSEISQPTLTSSGNSSQDLESNEFKQIEQPNINDSPVPKDESKEDKNTQADSTPPASDIEKKSLAKYFYFFIKWMDEGLKKIYDFLTGNVPKKAGTTVNSEKNNEKPGAPGTTPTVASEVKGNIEKQEF